MFAMQLNCPDFNSELFWLNLCKAASESAGFCRSTSASAADASGFRQEEEKQEVNASPPAETMELHIFSVFVLFCLFHT